jgi:hypothetical protein
MENSVELDAGNPQSEENKPIKNESVGDNSKPIDAKELEKKLIETASEAKKYRQQKALLKQRLEAIEAENEELKKKTLETQGNYKSLYEKAKEEKLRLEEKFKTQIGRYALNTIESSVREHLLMAKCQRPDAVLKLCQEQIRSFELDENFKPSADDVKSLVEEMQSQFPEWFKQETPNLKDGFPVGKMPTKQAKSIQEMTKEEIMQQLAALDKRS